MERIQQELLPKIKALCGRGLFEKFHPIPLQQSGMVRKAVVSGPMSRIDVLAIGTSTGGPNALAELLPAIPADFPVPIVIVQHMPPLFTKMLAERLNKQAAIHVEEGQPGKALAPGEAWIAPGDHHMIVQRHGLFVQLAVNKEPPENSCRPAVDVLFRSVAVAFGANTLAVVLTGMGSDGVVGSRAVHEKGGRVYVQDEASSVVWGMPGQVAAAGYADNIFPLREMAGEIDRRVRASRQLSTAAALRAITQ